MNHNGVVRNPTGPRIVAEAERPAEFGPHCGECATAQLQSLIAEMERHVQFDPHMPFR